MSKGSPVPAATPIGWKALHVRFGQASARRGHFRPALELALSVHPTARSRCTTTASPSPEPPAGEDQELQLPAVQRRGADQTNPKLQLQQGEIGVQVS